MANNQNNTSLSQYLALCARYNVMPDKNHSGDIGEKVVGALLSRFVNMCKKKLGLEINKDYILFVDSNSGKKRIQKRKDRFEEVLNILRNEYGRKNLEELVMIGVKRNDVPLWMNACCLHLLCSDQEGSPNSVKECLCCNVPCVTTSVGNVHDMLDDAPECYVSKSFNASELAELVNKSLLEHTTSLDLRCVVKNKLLDKESVSRKLFNIYTEIVKD